MSGHLAGLVNWQKTEGLVPAIIQDAQSLKVLMLGMMNHDALAQTEQSGLVTFYSRTRQKLWVKGESSGHYLKLISIELDCDQDALLIKAEPMWPTCHRQTVSCFDQMDNETVIRSVDELVDKSVDESFKGDGHDLVFLTELETIIASRLKNPTPQSYTARLIASGTTRMAQKVGEEGLEVALAAATGERQQLLEESADLVFHWLLLLKAQGANLSDVIQVLKLRHHHASQSPKDNA